MSLEPPLAAVLFAEGLEQARAYHDSLATVAVERGLIGPREVPRLWDRHLINSALLGLLSSDVLPMGASVCDVGSGAGLPGIPLALARPDLSVTLLEPLERRVVYLEEVVAQLGLANVAVVRGRAEERDVLALLPAFDVVTSRAVAPLPRLLEWCLPLTALNAHVAAIKGQSAAEEIRTLPVALQRRVDDVQVQLCQQPGYSQNITVVTARRRT